MKLDDAQAQKVREWVEAGASPAEVQNQLAELFGVRLTYMEVRFLLDDLKLELQDREAKDTSAKDLSPELGAEGSVPGESAADDLADDGGFPSGSVSVSVDQITRPGAVVSGKVTFSDGKGADWYLDQQGRLGLAPQEQGYRPSQEDVLAFQNELQNQLARHGF